MSQKRNPKFWFDNEKKVIKQLGLKPTLRSGGTWLDKEDGQNEYILAQLKSTEQGSITIKLSDLNNLIYNATVAHKIPIFVLQFLDGPILVGIQPINIKDVAKYLDCGKKQCTFETSHDIITTDTETEATERPIIKSSRRRESIKGKMKQEREKEFERRKTK